VGRIALFCIQDAPLGGESTIARNRDLNKGLPKEVWQFLEEHGGIEYSREFYDANNPPPMQLDGQQAGPRGSWQTKCELPDTAGREEAEEFFARMGFNVDTQITWDEAGTLRVSNYHPGYVRDPETGENVWWNIVHTGSLKMTDGEMFPKKMISEIQRSAWEHTYAFKLRPGDWLMLDNMRVQHGRLPYQDSPDHKRCLLTVYSHGRPSVSHEE